MSAPLDIGPAHLLACCATPDPGAPGLRADVTSLQLAGAINSPLGAPATFSVWIPGEPKGKARPRFDRRSGRAYTPAATENAEAHARQCMMLQAGQPLLEGPLEVTMLATVGIPASWSKRKQQEARIGILRPTGKPDLDNSCKLACDAGNGILWRDDSQIVSLIISKAYGDRPGVRLDVKQSA